MWGRRHRTFGGSLQCRVKWVANRHWHVFAHDLYVNRGSNVGAVYFGTPSTNYLVFAGSTFRFTGGDLAARRLNIFQYVRRHRRLSM